MYNERCKKFRKNQFFSNIFTFLSVIRQNFEDNLRILANFGKFSRKNSKIYGFRPYVFKKLQVFFFFVFFNKDNTFYTKNLFIRPKNCVQSILYKERCKEFHKNQFFSNIFTFLSVTRQNFEYNLRILANFGKFSRKNSKIYGFHPYVYKKLNFFVFFNKDYTFYTKNLFIRPNNCFQSILYKEICKMFSKNQFSSNIFTFLIVKHQNFEYNLRILANFGKFSRKNSKIYLFRPYVFKKVGFFLYFLIKIMLFTLKIYSFGPKIAFKSFFTTKDAKSFIKINFLVKFLHF